MSWGRRWTAADLQGYKLGKAAANIVASVKKITPEQSESDSNERRKFRNHKNSGEFKFCESFLK
ncbi:MAG: hypothetical protein WC637_08310 [Victivallales bacterium]|jgi:hypothetical protein